MSNRKVKMTKQTIKLNAEKRKVIADQFQNFSVKPKGIMFQK